MGRKPANFLTALEPDIPLERQGPRPLKKEIPAELKGVMDQYSISAMELLWEVATDPGHPWHKLWGFKALEILVNKTTPVRKETQNEGGVTLNIGAMLHSNSLEGPEEEAKIALELDKKEDGEPEEGKVDLRGDSGGSGEVS